MRTKSIVEGVLWLGLYTVALAALGACGPEGEMGSEELLGCSGSECQAAGRSVAALSVPDQMNLCKGGKSNGVVDPDTREQCDDGNLDELDGCTSECRRNFCKGGAPNGFKELGVLGQEECDDGNFDNQDGCTSFCMNNVCGDGFARAPSQACDDGNLEENDVCRTNCTWNVCGDGLQNGYLDPNDPSLGLEECDFGTTSCETQPCNDAGAECTPECKKNVCGDGYVWEGFEVCEPGQPHPTDPTVVCQPNCTWSTCGDGVVDDGEGCDEGEQNSDTGACTTRCLVARCGDDLVQAGVEVCDDGPANRETWLQEARCNTACTGWAPHCNDGVTNGPEMCDSGASNSDEWAATKHCNAACTGWGPWCGDGTANGTEVCDSGLENGQYDRCKLDCSGLGPHCGDEHQDTGYEDCDWGAAPSPNCAYNERSCQVCGTGCKWKAGVTSYCGDTRTDVDNGEQCDDGAGNGSTAACTPECKTNRCGDGYVRPIDPVKPGDPPREECDYGSNCSLGYCNRNDGPCTTGCELAECGDGKVCTIATCVDSPLLDGSEYCDDKDNNGLGRGYCTLDCDSRCGDGTPQGKEPCDDGNVDNGDRCTNECKLNVCGDGYLWPASKGGTEVCDEGGLNGQPGRCRSDCSGRCGDGQQNGTEECDDGNTSDNDECLTTVCKKNTCGDGKVWTGKEACDEGGLNGQPGHCRSDCSGRCGDEVQNGTEFCDSGTDCSDGVCNSDGWLQAKHCNASCTGWGPYCGDKNTQGPHEFCDDGTADGDGWLFDKHCLSNCSGWAPYCGDGDRNGEPEQCDLGPANGGYNVCSSQCKNTPDRYCTNGTCDPEEKISCGACPADCAGKLTCNDGNACTVSDMCRSNGTCTGNPKCPTNYGSWTPCSYANTCSTNGSQRRTVTEYSCQAWDGACVMSRQYTQTQSCWRDTDGIRCGTNKVCSGGQCVTKQPGEP